MTAISRRQLFAMGAAAAVAPVLPAVSVAAPGTTLNLMLSNHSSLMVLMERVMGPMLDEVERAYTDAVMFGHGSMVVGDEVVHVRLPPEPGLGYFAPIADYLEPRNG